MFIQPGDVAGALPVGDHGDHEHSDGSISDEEDDHDHAAHAYEDDEEAALLEDELHMMEQELNGQPQEVRRAVCAFVVLGGAEGPQWLTSRRQR